MEGPPEISAERVRWLLCGGDGAARWARALSERGGVPGERPSVSVPGRWRVGPAWQREKTRAGAGENAAPTGGAGQSGRAMGAGPGPGKEN